MVEKYQLSCCALCQITADNETSLRELQWHITKLQKEAEEHWSPKDRRSGERACFVITTPFEKPLERKLKTLGFKSVAEFNRRNGGYQPGILKMWFLNW